MSTISIKQKKDYSPLDRIREIVSDELGLVDQIIFELIQNKASLIPDISNHTITSGGKRLRPILTLACAKMCGYDRGRAHIDLAASVEFIHTATILHDDVVDKSDLRRGSLTANNLWGNKESILVGDFLLGKAFELMGSAESLEVYKILSKAAVVISEGEVKQLGITGRVNVEEYEYFEVIGAKTAELFAAACAVSGVIAKRTKDEVAALASYGFNLGLAFQIVDDVLDYSYNNSKLGKNVGDDFKEKKITLPVIIAYRKADSGQKVFWEGAFSSTLSDNNNLLPEAISFMHESDVLQEAIIIARLRITAASDALKIFPDSEIKETLLDILDFVLEREF